MTSRNDDQEDTFDAFFRESKRPLLAMAFVLTGNLVTAQDLTQEALLRTWVRWSRISKYDDPRAWARRVLYNLAVSKGRSDRVRQQTTGEMPRSSPAPDETHLMLAAALRSLPENQVRTLVLHDGAGMSISEVAAEMKAPEGTVKSWLSRGRASSAKALGSTEPTSKEGHASY